jgi:hypothetical protein
VAGPVIVTIGAVLSIVTVRVAVAALPLSSTARTSIAKGPSGSAVDTTSSWTSWPSVSSSISAGLTKVTVGVPSRLSTALANTSKVPRR